MEAGTRLGPYEIVSRIGAGGMGEVWRARDTRLGREVAIKIFPAEFARDAKLKIRFEREARTISHLSHPNICTLFDVGEDYIVMELLDGESLAERLARGPLPLTEVVRYGAQLAEALGKAHREGVVHRDLKPGNVMLTKSGAKLLDFGLAKLVVAASAEGATAQKPLTEEGVVLGTFQYMAPEQLAGEEPDARTDIFTLGAVLYEMTTGKRAFEGKSRTSLIGAIVSGEPAAMSQIQPLTPPAFEHVVKKCLAKDRDDRWQSAHDIAEELRWIGEAQSRPDVQIRPAVSAWKMAAQFTAAVALVVATATLTLWLSTHSRSQQPSAVVRARVTRTTVDLRRAAPLAVGTFTPTVGYFGTSVALSPDGSELVYVGWADGDTQIFRRTLDRDDVELIRRTRGAREAFFSPDGRSIAVITTDKLLNVPLDGRPPVVLGTLLNATRGVWRSGDTIYVGDNEGATIVHFSAHGEKAVDADLEQVSGERVRFSDVLPDGSAAIVNVSTSLSMSGDFSGTALLDLKSHKLVPLLDRSYDARYFDPGVLSFIRGGDLLAVRFDSRTRAVRGEPVLIASGVATESFFRRSQYAVSSDGSLAYVPGSDRSRGRIAVVDRAGRETFLNAPQQLYVRLDLSPDDRVLATHVSDVNDFLWVFDLQRQEGRRVPIAESVGDPSWRPDGKTLYAFAGPRPGGLALVEVDPNGGRSVRDIAMLNSKYAYLLGTSASGRTFLWDAGRGFRFIEGKNGRGLGQWEFPSAYISPDGRWIAYISSGEVYVRATSGGDQRYQIAPEGGLEPVWCRGCPEVFYRKGDQWYSVRVSTDGTFRSERPREVWRTAFVDTPGRSYEVSRDGQRLFISKRVDADVTDQIRLVRNWTALLPPLAASQK